MCHCEFFLDAVCYTEDIPFYFYSVLFFSVFILTVLDFKCSRYSIAMTECFCLLMCVVLIGFFKC